MFFSYGRFILETLRENIKLNDEDYLLRTLKIFLSSFLKDLYKHSKDQRIFLEIVPKSLQI